MSRDEIIRRAQRRTFLRGAGYGIGGLALQTLLDGARGVTRPAAAAPGAPVPSGKIGGVIREPHFPVRVKRVIHLCMAGGPSHLETFDWKPALKKLHGQPFPASFTKG